MRWRDLAEALRLQHTVFALPFAYLGSWVASASGSLTTAAWPVASAGFPGWRLLGWVTLAMIGARTAGMAWNRILDRPFDRANPRTAAWPTSQGRVTVPQLAALAVAATALFLYSASRPNPLCFHLSPLALLLLVFYPSLKRFTWACHWGLGLVLGMAPVGGWLAVTGSWDPRPLWLVAAVTLWVAGFDILYATLDVDFDRAHRLYSVPQRFGVTPALRIAKWSHGGMVLALAAFGIATQRALLYWIGWLAVAALLHYEHHLVSPTDLRRVNQAFFAVNGWVSVGLLLVTMMDCATRWPLPF